MLEKTLESPLDCKEIQPVHSKPGTPCGRARGAPPPFRPGLRYLPRGSCLSRPGGPHRFLRRRPPAPQPGLGQGCPPTSPTYTARPQAQVSEAPQALSSALTPCRWLWGWMLLSTHTHGSALGGPPHTNQWKIKLVPVCWLSAASAGPLNDPFLGIVTSWRWLVAGGGGASAPSHPF